MLMYDHPLFNERYAVDMHRWHMPAKFDMFVYAVQVKLSAIGYLNFIKHMHYV